MPLSLYMCVVGGGGEPALLGFIGYLAQRFGAGAGMACRYEAMVEIVASYLKLFVHKLHCSY